jgi:hypothetical protein
MPETFNPFYDWANLVKILRERYVKELGEERPLTPYAGEILGGLAEMITRCQRLGRSLEHLSESDKKSFDAFMLAAAQS